jgi:hypothetical protein
MRIHPFAVAALCALLMSFPAVAQEQVTVVQRDSTRFSGRFEAWSRQNNQIYVRVTQNDQRKVQLGDVLLFEVGGPAENLPAAETEAARGGDHVLVLTSGEIIRGRLLNIEGGEGSDTPNEPRVVSFKPSSGTERRARMNEVRRLYFGNYPQPATAAAAGSAPGGSAPSGAIRVAANQRWVSTGLVLSRGDQVQFESSGEVVLSGDAEDKAGTAGSMRSRYAPGAPMPQALAGALIGRVGNSAPFAIGNMTGVLTPPGQGGELVLGVNDDELGDNQGAFLVTVRVVRRR